MEERRNTGTNVANRIGGYNLGSKIEIERLCGWQYKEKHNVVRLSVKIDAFTARHIATLLHLTSPPAD